MIEIKDCVNRCKDGLLAFGLRETHKFRVSGLVGITDLHVSTIRQGSRAITVQHIMGIFLIFSLET